MNFFKNTFDLYLKSSTHTALAVVAFAGVTMQRFETEINHNLLLFIFFGAVTAYNFIKYSAVAKFHHLSLKKNLRVIQLYSLFCFIGLIYFALKQPLSVIVASAVFGLLALFYALPVFPDSKNLRSISGLKIFIIALVWAGVTVVLPVLTGRDVYIFSFVLTLVQRFLFVIVLTIPFDIRDLRFDQSHLGTIPQLYGPEKARSAGVVFLSIVVILEALKPVVEAGEIIALLVIVAVTYFLIRKAVEGQSKYLASFWIEGVPILWWGLLCLEKLLV